MAAYTIPLAGRAERFAIALNDTTYQFRLTYNEADEGGWVLDIGDQSGSPILCGKPLVTGVNLLAQHDHLGIGGQGSGLYVKTPSGEAPNYDNISDAELIFTDGKTL